MRKDWIRTEEECELRKLKDLAKHSNKFNKSTDRSALMMSFPIVVRKKQRLRTAVKGFIVQTVNNARFACTSHFVHLHFQGNDLRIFGVNRNLSSDDSASLSNISNAYQLGTGHVDGFRMNKAAPPASLIEYLNDESAAYESLIKFYKCIPNFKQLDLSDQILLIKCNMLTTTHLHYILIRNFRENHLVGRFMTQWLSAEFHQRMSRTRRHFHRFIKNPMVLKLILIVFLFSMSLSIPQHSSQSMEYKNSEKLYESQNFYAALLVRYLNQVFDENEAILLIQLIVTQMIHFQTLMNRLLDIIQTETARQGCSPLMKSLLQLT